MPYTEIGRTEYKLTLIAEHARKDKTMQFISLAHLLSKDYLGRCFFSLSKKKAKGIDNVGYNEYLENLDDNLNLLVEKLKNKSFKPLPARRVYIPKDNGEKRPLGISAIENKIVEKGIKNILESIYEQDFSDQSYGFRPNRNCHQALKDIHNQFADNRINHIIEADIKGFFDNVSHEMLMEFLKKRIKDSSMLYLINKFLKAGYVDAGLLVTSDEGTPQGSILSPLLANVYLHYVLDEWFENVVKSHTVGYCEFVRYADDFICVVNLQKDAEDIERVLYKRFRKYGLELHPEKTGRISFGAFELLNAKTKDRKPNTFEFLGFTHYCDRGRKGGFKIGRKTSKKKFNKKCKDMTDWLKAIRNKVSMKEWWDTLKAKLRGHFEYYGVSENFLSIRAFYNHTLRELKKWVNKRSQKKSMNWENFYKYLEIYPVPKPSIKHKFYNY